MTTVLSSANVQAGVYQTVLTELRKEAPYQTVELDATGTTTAPEQARAYQASNGVDAVLEVDARSVGIVGSHGPEPLLRLFKPITPGFLLDAIVPLYVAWFIFMFRFYVMPWLLGYSVLGMLSFPLESEISGALYNLFYR